MKNLNTVALNIIDRCHYFLIGLCSSEFKSSDYLAYPVAMQAISSPTPTIGIWCGKNGGVPLKTKWGPDFCTWMEGQSPQCGSLNRLLFSECWIHQQTQPHCCCSGMVTLALLSHPLCVKVQWVRRGELEVGGGFLREGFAPLLSDVH